MLDVNEDDDIDGNTMDNLGSNSNSVSNFSGNKTNNAIETGEKVVILSKSKSKSPSFEQSEKKTINNYNVSTAIRSPSITIVSQQLTPQQQKTNFAATFLQHKGITLKKTIVSTKTPIPSSVIMPEKNEKSIQLPETIKRKLNESFQNKDTKRIHLSNSNTTVTIRPLTPKAILPIMPSVVKVEPDEELAPGSVITLPANDANVNNITTVATTGNSAATSCTTVDTIPNGHSPSISEVDFGRNIVFDSNSNDLNGHHSDQGNNSGTEINNQGMPPVFFKNLCNSSRHEAFGLYMANLMNRLSRQAAMKLEMQILCAVSSIMNEEFTS